MATREALKALANKREALEAEMLAIQEKLDALGVGVSGPLVDSEGFPRADVDVHGIREDRHRLAVLKTDYVEVTQALDKGLQALHSTLRGGASASAPVPEPPKRARGGEEEGEAMCT